MCIRDRLQRVAYLAAKEANPDAVIHLGAFTYFWDPGYFDRFLDVLAADPDAAANDFYFDAATAHLYFQPNAVYNVLYAFRQVMADHGLDKPIWLVPFIIIALTSVRSMGAVSYTHLDVYKRQVAEDASPQYPRGEGRPCRRRR